MPDYKKMYHILFNAVTDAVENLQQAQMQAEEIFVADTDNQIRLPQKSGKNPRHKIGGDLKKQFKQPRSGRG